MARDRWDDPAPARNSWQESYDVADDWSRRLIQARQTPPDGIRLGKNLETRLPLYVTPDQLSTHMHVIGATGVGKSFFLEGIIKSLILSGKGVCLIDPHGDLYHRVLDFCAYQNTIRPDLHVASRVVPIDVAESRRIVGFNPVARNARVMTYQVVALMEAIRKCWGQGTFNETPRLARWLYNTGYAVIDSKVTFAQTIDMVNPNLTPERRAIVSRITDPLIRSEWDFLGNLKIEKQEERLESCFNRIREFIGNEVINLILGQYTRTIDFSRILSGQKIVLVNLARQNTISEDNQHLLGTLFINDLITAAFARPMGERTPFYVFIDEFQNFVTKDICEILDGGRKFGLHLILAHQHLHQLKEKDPEVYYSTLANARLKAVFGGLSDEDLEILAKELHTGELDPEQVKSEIWQTKYEPVETTRTICSSSTSESDSDSSGEVSHESIAEGKVFIPGSDAFSIMDPASTSTSSTRGVGLSRGSGHSSSRGQNVTEVPWYEYHKYQELTSRSFRSLEEQLYIKKAQMKRQPQQHAVVLIPDLRVQAVEAPRIRDFGDLLTDRQRQDFKDECFEAAGCFKTRSEAEREIADLRASLIAEGSQQSASAQPRGMASAAQVKDEAKTRAPIWDQVGNYGEPTRVEEETEAIQSSFQRKRGPKPDLENHAKVAKAVSGYGDAWMLDDNLMEICEALDQQCVPIPKTWPARHDGKSRSWIRAFENYPHLVIKAIKDRCKMAQAQDPSKLPQTPAGS